VDKLHLARVAFLQKLQYLQVVPFDHQILGGIPIHAILRAGPQRAGGWHERELASPALPVPVETVLLVALGGFVGTAFRYGLTGLVARTRSGTLFLFGTLTVNLVGCLAIGTLAALVETTEKIEAFLPLVDENVKEGLATVERVRIRLYRHGDRTDPPGTP